MLKLINDFLSLLYPELCILCNHSLFKNEKHICLNCSFHLPKTNFHIETINPVSRVFWGRAPIENAAAYLYFKNGMAVTSKKWIGLMKLI